ncbi:hypothetical protein DERP_010518 [Dermatophagoides pteronyssinus]|uniref:Alpha-1,3-mannosyl-glycoprotein 2-beta-N-acetylglucosaminyltransferase n=1 Tax=Dermatophagoides pteronyssinus TaxID=6956 RepID=A0ABQ8JFJ8_DERPT|nr:hypothetical protein DERP_010518 [Dermatophagoides pteronyssinus]
MKQQRIRFIYNVSDDVQTDQNDYNEDNNNNNEIINVNTSISVLLIVCDRLSLIQSTLNQLKSIKDETIASFQNRYNNNNETNINGHNILQMMINMPIFVSQDCGDENVHELIEKYVNDSVVQQHYTFPLQNKPINIKYKKFRGYVKVSRHYKWAINKIFRTYPIIDKLIIVEDDLNFSPDFFEYFLTLSTLLDNDNRIYCISAWNDNGKDHLINHSAISLLYLTDFFPGLGWMLKRSFWYEIKDKWPDVFWDDWLRQSEQRKNRLCIRPELSRTSTSGMKGVSRGQFFKQHLSFIHHFDRYFPFFQHQNNIVDQLYPENYDQKFLYQVYNKSQDIHPVALKKMDPIYVNKNIHSSYRLTYYTKNEFIEYASMFGLMNDIKYGVPRTAYKGIISFMYNGLRIYLSPPVTLLCQIKKIMMIVFIKQMLKLERRVYLAIITVEFDNETMIFDQIFRK